MVGAGAGMLRQTFFSRLRHTQHGLRSSQSGVVLLVALIMLIAMTLAGIALVRSVDTATIVAGNLSFQQSATLSGDIGLEQGIGVVETFLNNNLASLDADIPGSGYVANGLTATPARNPDESWSAYWARVWDNGTRIPVTLPIDDVTGNTISYVIDRLCVTAGTPGSAGVNCSTSPTAATGASGSSGDGGDEEGGAVKVIGTTGATGKEAFYRITVRIQGPRNSLSYVQSVVYK